MEKDLVSTIVQAKELISEKKYPECEALICAAMLEYPHDAVPHNLMGLMLESENSHVEAMKHFRAAYSLDPTYQPSLWNMECYGSYTMPHPCAYFQHDCETGKVHFLHKREAE
ncbi:MAG: hypothetical protein VB055_10585 [Oscillospiraceae bacterium]|nr:hypothetical protein [Oscillospiraceae bacterium]